MSWKGGHGRAGEGVTACRRRVTLLGLYTQLPPPPPHTHTGSLVVDIVRAPIQIIVGILYGVVFGLLLWIFPTKQFVSTAQAQVNCGDTSSFFQVQPYNRKYRSIGHRVWSMSL